MTSMAQKKIRKLAQISNTCHRRGGAQDGKRRSRMSQDDVQWIRFHVEGSICTFEEHEHSTDLCR